MADLLTNIASAPPYFFRRSARAKRISLRLLPRKGIEIVLPKRASEHAGLRFLHEKQHWVEQHWEMTQVNEELPIELPTQLHLRALNQQLPIRYEKLVGAERLLLQQNYSELCFVGCQATLENSLSLLINWLKEKADRHLSKQLDQVSAQCNLSFSKLSWRWQKTVWGSCNNKQIINLNCKLIFLPPELVRYVMIHELSHTIWLDHSPQFWALVAKYEPEYHRLRRELKHADQYIPRWLCD